MKRVLVMLVGVGLLLSSQACAVKKEEAIVPKDDSIVKKEVADVSGIGLRYWFAARNKLERDRRGY